MICTSDDVRGDFLGRTHDTTTAAVKGSKIKQRSFKSSEHISEIEDGPYRGLATRNQRELL